MLWILLVMACLDPGLAPKDGLWTYVDDGVVENTCGLDLEPAIGGLFGVSAVDDGSFLVDDGESVFACLYVGASVTCPERPGGEYPIDGTDTVVRWGIVVDATLESPTEITGTQTATGRCEGTFCGLGALLGVELPCTYAVAFHAVGP